MEGGERKKEKERGDGRVKIDSQTERLVVFIYLGV